MATEYKTLTEIYRDAQHKLADIEEWCKFLTAACRNYRLPFDEQLLIFAQRPDAAAVLPINGKYGWNQRFGRWVNSGAKGIAVFDRSYAKGTRLKYYFDISDTHETNISRPVPLWTMRSEYELEVIETLGNSFGDLDKRSKFTQALFSAAKNAAEDNIPDYTSELLGLTKDSFLEELDELNIALIYKNLVQNSIGYMLLVRCGMNPEPYFDNDDFRDILNFNTPETINALGTATSSIAQMCLSEIARTVLSLERQAKKENRTFADTLKTLYAGGVKGKEPERSVDNERNHIQQAGRVQPTESASAAGNGGTDRKIRVAEAGISQGTQENHLHESANHGNTEYPFSGDRTDGGEPIEIDDETNERIRRNNRGIESERPREVGRTDEQYPSLSGGDYSERTDLQLNKEAEEKAGGGELPAFLDEKLIMAVIANKDDDLKYKKHQIVLFFSAHSKPEERAGYIKSAYQDRYTEIIADGVRVGYKPQDNGLLIWKGSYLSRTHESVFSWDIVAEWTGNLIEKKEYLIETDVGKLKNQAVQQMSLFDFVAENNKSLEANDGEQHFSFPLPQQIIDESLCLGSNEIQSRLTICAYFMKDKPLTDNAYFLKKHYGENGAGFYFNDRKISIWYNEDGIRIAYGSSARQAGTLITWEQAAKRIRELLDMGRYMPQSELEQAEDFERKNIAEQLLFLYRDIDSDKTGQFFPTLCTVYETRTDFSDMSEKIKLLLEQTEQVKNLTGECMEFLSAYEKDRNIMRFHYHQPKKILHKLQDLQREPLRFTAEENFPQRRFFISDDEIDNLLRGSKNNSDYRLAVYSFYRNHNDRKEREKFLKNLHGEYSGFSGGNDDVMYQNKGVYFSHGRIMAPYAKAELKWHEVEKRIDFLISHNQFLSDHDRAVMPQYEKQQIARNIRTFFENVPQGQPRPYPYETEFWGAVKLIEEQLDDPAHVEEIYRMMVPVWKATAQDNRLYSMRQRIFENISAFRQGTFTLFAEKKEHAGSAAIPEYRSKKETEPVILVESDHLENLSAIPEQLIEESGFHEPQTADEIEEQEGSPKEEQEIIRLVPPKPYRQHITFNTIHSEIPKEQRYDFQITNDDLGTGSRGEKFEANVKAIHCLKKIEAEDRLATPEEQEILSRYVGWGGLSDCFDERHSKYQELKSFLNEEEYEAARESSLTAFYTPPAVIRGIYQALEQMGFAEGNILEPCCGIGNFMGMLPESMRESKFYGVELDSISGRIAGQLYQNSSISVNGFETVEMPDSFFDVVVGNVPFGDFKVLDKQYDKFNFLIHDYFFAKTIDKVRPGGVLALITSNGIGGGTFDKQDRKVREYIAQRCDLIGAVRLPNNTFSRNAGADLTTDILFLQKLERQRSMEVEAPEWVNVDVIHENDFINSEGESRHQKITLNRYYKEHPEMVLGNLEIKSGPFGPQLVCSPVQEADFSEQLKEAVSRLKAEITPYEIEDVEEIDDSIPAVPDVKNFSYTIADGTVYFRNNSRMYPYKGSVTAENRIRGMIALRDCVYSLIFMQTENYPDDEIKKEQQKLSNLYDEFVKKYGLISGRGNDMAFSEDSGYYLLCSLEVLDKEGNFKRKADIFSKRTIRPHIPVSHVDTASEALAVSISEKAKVDIEYMSELSGKTPEELETELSGVIFRDIDCPETAAEIAAPFLDLNRYPLVTSDEYLSGNVRQKLRMAKALWEVLPAEKKARIKTNTEALETVQPKDLAAGDISVRISVNWIPLEIYQQFMYELLDTSIQSKRYIKILRSEHSSQWNITGKSTDRGNVKANKTYGTDRLNAYQILEQTLNQKDVLIFDYIEDENGNRKAVLNKRETAIAQDKQELIKQKFKDWIWKGIDRRNMLCRIYNERYNSIRPREYNGEHITFSGMAPDIALRPHQINAIAHIMYGGNTLLAHEVGAGKTFEMIAASMEMKRLGLCTKSMVVVPNHITKQWASEWLRLYPASKILVATKKDFETKNRKKFCSRIATGDYDAVIIGHSQFEKIPMSIERQTAFLRSQLFEITQGIENAKAAKAERYTVKQMEKTKKKLRAKLKKLNDTSRKDNIVTFEQLGVDRLFVDESHYYKNLFFVTKMRNVRGIAQTEAQKCSDLVMKIRYLDEITNNHGTISATGTPISNSMVELYSLQKYLQYEGLKELRLIHFDDWAANSGETVIAMELNTTGTGLQMRTRFARFYNLPELMSVFKLVADIQTADMLNLPVPKANFHVSVLKPSELQKEMVKGLAERAEEIHKGGIDPRIDNMLKITNDGRKLALDMRLVNPLAPDDPNGKIAVCAQKVFHIWKETEKQRSTQLVFCDLSTPKNDGMFNVYDDLKQKLVTLGIPEEEIAFIHDANSDVQREKLFAKVRLGKVRVLMGSTQKMGAGTNMQDKLIANHDLDCPWRPSDLQQRLGRLVRQGNEKPDVEVYRDVTEGTFDAYLYQLIENKQKVVAQIMTSKTPVRVAEDIDDSVLNYAEIKALATGNPLIIEKSNLDMEISRLKLLKASYMNQQYELEELVVNSYPKQITALTEYIKGYERDMQLAAENPKPENGFAGMEIMGEYYTEKEKAGKAIIQACAQMTETNEITLGTYRGFSLTLFYYGIMNQYKIKIKGAMSYTVPLGEDIFGNITRLDNAIANISGTLEADKAELEDIKVQLKNAQEEMAIPFPKEKELEEKTKRLNEIIVKLRLDEKDKALIDDVPDEAEEPEKRNVMSMAR